MMRGKTFFEKKIFPRAPYPKNFMREGMDYVCGGLREEDSECRETMFLFLDISWFLWYTIGKRT